MLNSVLKVSQFGFPQLISPGLSARGGIGNGGWPLLYSTRNSHMVPCSILCMVWETQTWQYLPRSSALLCYSSTLASKRTEEPLWSCSSGRGKHLFFVGLLPKTPCSQPWQQVGLTGTPVPALTISSSVTSGKIRRRHQRSKGFYLIDHW